LAAGLIAFALPACGDQKDASLCTAYSEFLDARAHVQALDPATLNASDAQKEAQSYLDSVHRLQQASDNRYTQQLDALELAANDVVLTLQSVRDDADYSTWGPLVEDDLETAGDAAQVVQDAIAPSCNPDTSGT
jgi:hypothetical protein